MKATDAGNGPTHPTNQALRQVPRQTPAGFQTPVLWRTVRVGSEFACGIAQTVAASGSGKVYCWGRNDFGQAGTANTTNPVLAPNLVGAQGTMTFYSLGAGTTHACATAFTATNQRVWCWGRNNRGQLGAAQTHPTGTDSPNMVQVSGPFGETGLPNNRFYQTIDAGAEATCTVASFSLTALGGDAYCWGINTAGQLGLDTSTNIAAGRPQKVAEPLPPPPPGQERAPGPRVVAGGRVN